MGMAVRLSLASSRVNRVNWLLLAYLHVQLCLVFVQVRFRPLMWSCQLSAAIVNSEVLVLSYDGCVVDISAWLCAAATWHWLAISDTDACMCYKNIAYRHLSGQTPE